MKNDGFLDDDAIALLSAALRHVRDAERLLAESPDQTYHLAGFGPECARKAVLDFRWADKSLGHDLGEASETLLDFLDALDPRAQRYLPALSATTKAWNPQVRYEKTGTRGSNEAKSLVEEARLTVDGMISALWADGRIPAKKLAAEGL